MDPAEFEREKRRVMRDGWPSSGDNLGGMVQDFDWALSDLEELHEPSVDVASSRDPERLVAASCVARRGTTLAAAARSVELAWMDTLRYSAFEAHLLTVNDGRATLNGITQIAPGHFYVTARVDVRVFEDLG